MTASDSETLLEKPTFPAVLHGNSISERILPWPGRVGDLKLFSMISTLSSWIDVVEHLWDSCCIYWYCCLSMVAVGVSWLVNGHRWVLSSSSPRDGIGCFSVPHDLQHLPHWDAPYKIDILQYDELETPTNRSVYGIPYSWCAVQNWDSTVWTRNSIQYSYNHNMYIPYTYDVTYPRYHVSSERT